MAAYKIHLGGAGHQPVVLQAIGNKIGDGGDFQIVFLGERHQFRQPRHGAIIVHDLTDDAGGNQPGEPRHIHRRFGMSSTHQHAAVTSDQRKDVAGRDDVAFALGRVDGHRNGVRPIVRRNAGGDAFARFDRYRERRLMPRAVAIRHQRQAKLGGALVGQRQANQAAAMLGHEVDRRRRRHLGWNDKIAFVLAVLVIDQDEHAAVAGFFDNLGNG